MQQKDRGEAAIKVTGDCLSPSHLSSLSAKRLRKPGRFFRSRPSLAAEELLFVPYYYFRFVNPKHRDRFYLYEVLVDAVLGYSEFIRGVFDFKELSVSREFLLDRSVFRQQAESRAREAVRLYVLRKQSLWVKEIKVELTESGEMYYPYWVSYLKTSRGLELSALNGLTGRPAGPRPETVLQAAIAKAEMQLANR